MDVLYCAFEGTSSRLRFSSMRAKRSDAQAHTHSPHSGGQALQRREQWRQNARGPLHSSSALFHHELFSASPHQVVTSCEVSLCCRRGVGTGGLPLFVSRPAIGSTHAPRNQSYQRRKRKYTQLRRAGTFAPAGLRCLSAHGPKYMQHPAPFHNLKHASPPPALLLLQSSPVCQQYNCGRLPVFLHRSRFASRPYSFVCSPQPTPPIITSVASRSQPCY